MPSASPTQPAMADFRSIYTIDDIDTILNDDDVDADDDDDDDDDGQTYTKVLGKRQACITSQRDKDRGLCIDRRHGGSERDSKVVDEETPTPGTEGEETLVLPRRPQPMITYTEYGLEENCDQDGDISTLYEDAVKETERRSQELFSNHHCSDPNKPKSPTETEGVNQQDMELEDRPQKECFVSNVQTQEVGANLDEKSSIGYYEKAGSKKDTEDEDEDLPVDKGWAWVVLAGTFLNTMLFVGYIKSLSILFVEYLRLFDASATTTSLIMGVSAASYSISALFTMHFVLERLTVRKTALLGAFISTVAMATGVFAPNITFLVCVHSGLTGIGHSMLLGPGLVLLGQYFNKRRGLAVSISMSSISVAAGVFPMLTRLLLDRYHIRGTMLIFTGLTMNIFVGASLFRPLDSHRRNRSKLETIKVEDSNGNAKEPLLKVTNNLTGSRRSLEGRSMLCSSQTSKENYVVLKEETISGYTRLPILSKRKESLSESCPSLEVRSAKYNDHHSSTVKPHVIQRNNGCGNTRTTLLRDSGLTGSSQSLNRRSVPRKDFLFKEYLTVQLNHSSQGRSRTYSNCSKRSHHEDLASSRKMLYASNPETLAVSVLDLETTSESRSDDNSQTEDDRPKCGCNIIDLTLFKKPMFRLFAVCAMLGIISNVVPNYLPVFVSEKGIGQTDAALLLLILGTVDFFSRISIGYFVDLKILRASRLIAIGLLCAGTSAQLARLYNTFPLMIMFSVIHGVVGSAYQSLVPILIVEFLGKEYLGKTLGYSSMFHGLALAITHPIIGAIKDISGTFNNTYTYLGTCAYAAALCLLIGEPLCRRKEVDAEEECNHNV